VIGFVDWCRDVLHVEFSPAQRVLWLVAIDGVQPRDLEGEDRDLAAELFGSEVGEVPADARTVLALLKGARVGGTWGFALYLLYRALTADCSTLAAGEVGFCTVVAPDLKTARQAARYALGAAEACADIAPLVESQDKDGFTLRQHDGQVISIE